MQAKYRRVLLKVSGEALAKGGTGIDPEKLAVVAAEVKQLQDMGVQVGIVCGGGNFWRGRSSEKMDRATADQIGMLATCMNGLALKDAFTGAGLKAELMAAFSVSQMCKEFNVLEARKLLEEGYIVIFTGGTGHPFFSTDTGAALRAIEIQADVILLAKNVDGIYDSDPKLNPNAKKLDEISYKDFIARGLKAMDTTAITLCMENKIPVLAFGLYEKDALLRAITGDKIGTIIK